MTHLRSDREAAASPHFSTYAAEANALWSELFAEYGWQMSDEFLLRYQADPWVYNLANALLNERRRYNELRDKAMPAASCPGPDASWSGVDDTPVDNAAKVWRCDVCGAEGVAVYLSQQRNHTTPAARSES